MNLKHLNHLLALAETGSFSRAAERECLTQSALSRSIRSLEQSLGGTLVDRSAKLNELTPFGQEVAARARHVVHEAGELERAAKSWSSGRGGTIRVGLGSGPAALLMTPLLCHVARNGPEFKVSISRGPTELQLQQLRARQLDALVVDVRQVVPHPDLNIEPPANLRGGFVCRAAHPLLKRTRLGIHDVLRYPVAATPLSGEVARLLVDLYGPRANPGEATALMCEDVASLIAAVEMTDAVYMGIVAAAKEGLNSGRLIELPVKPALRLQGRFAYITLAGRTASPAMGPFRKFVAERLRD